MDDDIVVVEEIKTSALTLAEQARAFVVRTQADVEEAGSRVRNIDAVLKRINEHYDPRIEQAHSLHKSLLAAKREFAAPIEAAKSEYKTNALAWVKEQERIANEEAARIARESREREEKARLATAAALEEAGEVEQAQAMMDAPVQVAVPEKVRPSSVLTRSTGFTAATTWKARVTDEAKLFAYCAAHPEFRHIWKLDQGALDKLAKAMKGAMNLDGAVPYEDTDLRSGRK